MWLAHLPTYTKQTGVRSFLRGWLRRLLEISRWGRKARLREDLRMLLQAEQPRHAQNLRKREFRALSARALAEDPNPESLYREAPATQKTTLAILLQRVIDLALVENQQRESQYRSLYRQCEFVIDEQTHFALVDSYLREQAKNSWQYRGDRRALSRYLDLDALRERCDEGKHKNLVHLQLAAAGIARLWLDALESASDDRPHLLERAQRLAPAQSLASLLDQPLPWQCKLELAKAVAKMLQSKHFAALDQSSLRVIEATVDDRDEHPWLRDACLSVLEAAHPQRALQMAKTHLQEQSEKGRAPFLFRRLILRRLISNKENPSRARAELLEHWERGDRSEHLRLRLAQDFRELQAPASLILRALSTRIVGSQCRHPEEHSELVRGAGVSSLSTLVARLLRDDEAQRDRLTLEAASKALAQILLSDPSEWVQEHCCREIQSLAETITLSCEPTPLACSVSHWQHACAAALGQAHCGLSLQRRLCETLEALAICAHDQARVAYKELRDALGRHRAASRFKYFKSPSTQDLSSQWWGRIAAHLSRLDWGIYLSDHSSYLKVQRGERSSMRLWRVLHELRTPSPNKRTGFVHSSARRYAGSIRAHSGILHEATPTVVPGERVALARERGWGRYLPLVDDLLSSPFSRDSNRIEIFSSLGVTRIVGPSSLWRRLYNFFYLSLHYSRFSDLRRRSLEGDGSHERAAFSRALQETLSLELRFEWHQSSRALEHADSGRRLQALFLSDPAQEPKSSPHRPSHSRRAAALAPWAALDLDPEAWFKEHAPYLLSGEGNDQFALTLFLTGVFGLFLFEGFRQKRAVDLARNKIPLSIGGWGTRGKSGTERLKAALFHAMGYRVFSKTTGCEAMLIHSVAMGPSSEIFVFRPYGKATIWEQKNLLSLAAKLNVDVFLWECMALNPTYVEILQQGWMRDDIATITNAYPDHEDIQGPAGMDVATVISGFIPKNTLTISSEHNFHPLMRDRAQEVQSAYQHVSQEASELIGGDLLALFPYQEHPQNIALVTAMGQSLGLDPDLCMLNMIEEVVPDLGVLKSYGQVRVCGRRLTFINGCSANERAGFLNNWQRSGCSNIDLETQGERAVITVVNNRADRVSRSEVFARILINDAAVDKHILIGGNLGGLMNYMRDALRDRLASMDFLSFPADATPESVEHSFDQAVLPLRVAPCRAALWLKRLSLYALGLQLELPDTAHSPLAAQLETQLGNLISARHDLAELRSALEVLRPEVEALLSRATERKSGEPPECYQGAGVEELWVHWRDSLARSILLETLRQGLKRCLSDACAKSRTSYRELFHQRYEELCFDAVEVIHNSEISGDQLVLRCARSVAPGCDLTIMGTQNIKGTGLDFVYRWISLDRVMQDVEILRGKHREKRAQALARLASFSDPGLLDLGLLCATLPELSARYDEESEALQQLQTKAGLLYRRACRGLEASATGKRRGALRSALDWVEGWFEFLDGARRYFESQQIQRDLAAQRISHARAALEMRQLYARTKGGWLANWLLAPPES